MYGFLSRLIGHSVFLLHKKWLFYYKSNNESSLSKTKVDYLPASHHFISSVKNHLFKNIFLDYKTLIRGANVVDGSSPDSFRADVAITSEGTLSVISPGKPATAEQVVDADGLYLAPGFIDVHTHDDTVVINNPGMEYKISQGVTTVITGNCGISASPVTLKGNPPNPMNLLGEKKDFTYPKFSDYVKAVNRAKPSVNVAALVGHTSLRNNVMDSLNRPATESEIKEMRKLLRQALNEGAIGLSSGLAYDSAYEAPEAEVKALVEEVAQAGGIYTTHMRTEFDGILDAITEAFDTAKHGSVPLIISHLKCAGAANWGRSGEVLDLVSRRGKSHPFACDCYPYSASSSTIDPGQVTSKNDIFITWSEPHPEKSGNMLADIAEDWGLSLLDAAKKLMPGGAVYHCMSEEDVKNILQYERAMIGSDGLPLDPFPHPRLWGAFPRVIGHYCRDLGLFSLPEAIHKMTGLSAKEFGLKNRGLIADGYHADLVLFDYEKIKDMATYSAPKQPADGIERVWVNGDLSYQPGRQMGTGAGKFIPRQ